MSEPIPDSPPADLRSSLRDLYDKQWLARASAAHRLTQFPEATLPEIARFFELTFDDHAPVSDVARVAIAHMKAAAVPFLIEQTRADDAACRTRAMELLSVVGDCGGEPHQFATHVLGRRNDRPPHWGDGAESVLRSLRGALSDLDFSVRFAAASLLEDCGRSIDDTLPVFIEALSRGTSFQKLWAALRLGRIGPMAGSACEALADLASGRADRGDRWHRYAVLAAQVALKRIA